MSLLMQALKMAEQSRQIGPASEELNGELKEEALPTPSVAKRENPADTSKTSAGSASPAPAMQLNPPPAASTVPLTDFPSLGITEPELSLLAQEEQLLEEFLAKGEAASWDELPSATVENATNRSDSPPDSATESPTSSAAPQLSAQLGLLDNSAGRLGLGQFAAAPLALESGLDDFQIEPMLAAPQLNPRANDSLSNQPAIAAKSAPRSEPGNAHAPYARDELGELKPMPEKPDDLAGITSTTAGKAKAAPATTRAHAQDQAKSVFGAKKGPKSKQPLLFVALSATCAVLIGGYFYLQNQNSSNTLVNLRPGNLAAQAPIVNAAPNPAVNPTPNGTGADVGATSAISAANTPTTALTPPVLASASTSASAPAAVNSTPTNSPTGLPANLPANALGQTETPKETIAKSAVVPPARAHGKPSLAVQDEGIQLARTTSRVQISPGLEGAYRAYQQGDLATAQLAYRTLLQQEPNNRDAILGLAASAMRLNNAPEAANLYLRLLELDPYDPDATAALIGMQQSDPQQAESRLKKILNQHPQSASLHFMLGNVYAQQERWSDAQQSYFRAFSNAPSNADYLFNLAVSLDRLGQSKLALDYYQRALHLAQSTGSGFSGSAVQERIRDLQTQLSNSGK